MRFLLPKTFIHIKNTFRETRVTETRVTETREMETILTITTLTLRMAKTQTTRLEMSVSHVVLL